MNAKPPRPTEKIALVALAIGAALGFGAAYIVPGGPWWVYAAFGLLGCGAAYGELLKIVSREKIIDRGDWPTKGES